MNECCKYTYIKVLEEIVNFLISLDNEEIKKEKLINALNNTIEKMKYLRRN